MPRKFETIAIAGWALVNRRGERVPWSTQLLDHDPSNTPESAHDVSRKSADVAHPDMAPHRWQAMWAVPGDDGFEQAEGSTHEHTPGRIEVTEGDDTHVMLVARWSDQVQPGKAPGFGDYRGIQIAELQHHSGDGAAPKEHAYANARRLAACWNACEGIRTEIIERSGMTRSGLAKSLQSMQQQLDELLAALRRLSFAAMSRDNTMGDPSSMLAAKAELSDANKQAMQAINNVTGVNHENSQR